MSNAGQTLKGRMFRTLRADEIDVRVGQEREKGVSLLLYKDARCDMNILDETITPMNWQRTHSRDNANCIVSIWSGTQWVSKEDTGVESKTEAEKGKASDAFKRACVNWGIGRELYTAPFIWVSSDKLEYKEVYGKKRLTTTFAVSIIDYDDNANITELEIVNGKTGEILYKHKGERAVTERTDNTPTDQPKAEEPIRCESCGMVIEPTEVTCKGMKVLYQPRDIQFKSMQKFGKTYCYSCCSAAAKAK